MNIVDCTLGLHNDEMKEALRVVKIALLCLQLEPNNRPTMARVVAMLQGEAEIIEIVLDNNLEIENMNKICENTFLSSTINSSSISNFFEKSNVPMLKGSSSSSQIDDFASKYHPFEI
jgi:predicted O-linked N-acetylglucosamine transferase (SPINDLY family)